MASEHSKPAFKRSASEPQSNKGKTNLLPKQSDCSYVSCYCEENVYQLCQHVSKHEPNELPNCWVVFISNNKRTVPLWKQKAGKDEDRLVIWDYHVLLLHQVEQGKCLVYDLESELPFPTYVHRYITETFRTDHILKPDFYRYFRVIAAQDFLDNFSSDRRHMKRPDGTWIKPPPTYPCFFNQTRGHNLDDYIQMDTTKGPGQVYNLAQFVQRFYRPVASSTT